MLLVLMGYLNLFVIMGYECFVEVVVVVGIDGLIVVDFLLCEVDELIWVFVKYGFYMILFVVLMLEVCDFVVEKFGIGGFFYCILVVGLMGGLFVLKEVIVEVVE